jgi:K+-sensing histidine kinase KdpD
MSLERHKSWVLAAAAVLPILVCALLSTVRGDVTAATDVLLLVLVVVAAASSGIRVAGVVAAVSAGASFDFFLTQPYLNLAIDDRNDIEATVLLVVIGAAVTEVALWGHRMQASANRREGYLDGVLGAAETVILQQEPPERLVDHIAEQIRLVLGVSACRFVPGPVRDQRIPVLEHEGHVTRSGHVVDVERDGLPTDDNIALVVRRGTVAQGHFLVTAASDIARPTLEQRKVAVLLADQAGVALTRPGR